MKPEYGLGDGEIVVTDGDTGAEVWRGYIDGTPVQVILPQAEDCVSLLNPWEGPKDRPFQNLVRLTPSGQVRWRAELPDMAEADAYLVVQREGEELVATSWSGYRAHINPDDGHIVTKDFAE